MQEISVMAFSKLSTNPAFTKNGQEAAVSYIESSSLDIPMIAISTHHLVGVRN
jgi:hypothetical protein